MTSKQTLLPSLFKTVVHVGDVYNVKINRPSMNKVIMSVSHHEYAGMPHMIVVDLNQYENDGWERTISNLIYQRKIWQ